MTSSAEDEKKVEQTTETITPLFDGAAISAADDDDGDDEKNKQQPAIVSFAAEFRDKVRVLFEHFDQDRDGFLNFKELKELQDATSSGSPPDGDEDDELDDDLTSSSSNPTPPSLTEEMYVMACKTLNCHPSNGLSLEALKFTYAADGADIDKDFKLVFTSDGKPRRDIKAATRKSSPSTRTNDDNTSATTEDTKTITGKTTIGKTKPRSESSDDDDKIYEVGADGAIDISS